MQNERGPRFGVGSWRWLWLMPRDSLFQGQSLQQSGLAGYLKGHACTSGNGPEIAALVLLRFAVDGGGDFSRVQVDDEKIVFRELLDLDAPVEGPALKHSRNFLRAPVLRLEKRLAREAIGLGEGIQSLGGGLGVGRSLGSGLAPG